MAGFESSGSVMQAETAQATRPISEKGGRVVFFYPMAFLIISSSTPVMAITLDGDE
jgi:hypothetical protein